MFHKRTIKMNGMEIDVKVPDNIIEEFDKEHEILN